MSGWKSVDEVIAYQLAVRLRDEILTLVKTGPASNDWRYRDQIRDSARSAPRNISEGFARYNHGEFSYFVNVPKASLAETLNHLKDGRAQSYFSTQDSDRTEALATEAFKTASGLFRYLKSSKTPRPYWLANPAKPVTVPDRKSHEPEPDQSDY